DGHGVRMPATPPPPDDPPYAQYYKYHHDQTRHSVALLGYTPAPGRMAQHAAGDFLHTLARLRTEERHLLESCELLLTTQYLLQPQGIGCAGTPSVMAPFPSCHPC